MPFGTLLDSRTILGLPAARGVAPIHMSFLCDGGSRPNPGVSKPVVWDGNAFLPIMSPVRGTNHRSVYDAVYAALDFAKAGGATELTIELSSHLVWGQIADNGVGIKLNERRDKARDLAARFTKVEWRLVGPPFIIGRSRLGSPRSLRRFAER